MRTGRSQLVHRMRTHLERHCYPRVELSVLIVLSGLSAFLVSFLLLGAGFTSMPVRYGVAGIAGYVAFLGFVRLWIAWNYQRRSILDLDIDAANIVDAIDVPLGIPRGGSPGLFGGGRSSGGGSSGSWSSAGSDGGAGTSWFDDAGDSLGLVILVAMAVAGSLLAIGYVVYVAPALLAEVLVDAVIVATISRRLARSDRRDWTATLLRRTWAPAVALVALLIAGGWALQRLAPDAHSIGPALEAIRD